MSAHISSSQLSTAAVPRLLSSRERMHHDVAVNDTREPPACRKIADLISLVSFLSRVPLALTPMNDAGHLPAAPAGSCLAREAPRSILHANRQTLLCVPADDSCTLAGRYGHLLSNVLYRVSPLSSGNPTRAPTFRVQRGPALRRLRL